MNCIQTTTERDIALVVKQVQVNWQHRCIVVPNGLCYGRVHCIHVGASATNGVKLSFGFQLDAVLFVLLEQPGLLVLLKENSIL